MMIRAGKLLAASPVTQEATGEPKQETRVLKVMSFNRKKLHLCLDAYIISHRFGTVWRASG